MAALFPPGSNTAIRTALIAIVAALLAVPLVLVIYMRTPDATGQGYPIDQPVEFDHRHHVRDDGIDCRFCHGAAERSAYAGIPATEVCMGCHSQVWKDSALLDPVRRSQLSGRPIQWNRVYDLPDFVYFNHAIHVNKGVGCVSCHGRVDLMPRVYQVPSLSMSWCLSCHRKPEPHLRPREAITQMDWSPQGDRAALGRELARQYQVRRLTYCTACHR